ncbi:hypothetical protein I8J29_22270 [Paenibacillus sp. MWE-103]|uniref:Uncharacterized protein n=1 Tax=Paenibacillus artemisiicola TaxID=1172618 RepID=A0ABS3WF41_9BACL|nr:hypothetical protein [Paenibacillus artemisiicola]MBO7746932.1 hypothetical protein [Paenibacillus artemisiicola]
MEQIYPLHEENIKRFCGMPVCVVTNEGQRHYGILSRCHEGRIVLNERPATADGQGGLGGQATSGVHKGKVTNQKSKKQKKGKAAAAAESKTTGAAQTQAYYPYDPYGYYGDWYGGFGFGGDVLAFDLAALAFLFLLI